MATCSIKLLDIVQNVSVELCSQTALETVHSVRINIVTYFMHTLALALYRDGHLEVVKYLICKHNCNLYSSDEFGRTPLHLACL